MKFPGYWVVLESGNAILMQTTFDETDLDPETNWTEAWQNRDMTASAKGYVELKAALVFAAHSLALSSGRNISLAETDQIVRFQPAWTDGRCEIKSISELICANADLSIPPSQ